MSGHVATLQKVSSCHCLQVAGETDKETGIAGKKTVETVRAVSLIFIELKTVQVIITVPGKFFESFCKILGVTYINLDVHYSYKAYLKL